MRARHTTTGAEAEDTGIDLAPMLDFVLNLLIFFIITTSFVKESGIVVSLVEAQTPESSQKANILISVRENGDIWMNRRQVDIREVRGLVERMHVERSDDTVIVVADKAARNGLVAAVMDEVKLGGIGDIALAARPIGDN